MLWLHINRWAEALTVFAYAFSSTSIQYSQKKTNTCVFSFLQNAGLVAACQNQMTVSNDLCHH